MSLLKGRIARALVASSALLLSSLGVAADWQLEMDENGVQLYSMESTSSPLKTVKVVSQVKASLSSLVSFLSDNNQFPAWMDKISKAEKIKDISPQETLTYTVIDSPWPERDRDNVIYSKWEQDPQSLVVTKKILSEPQYVSENPDMIRTPFFEGEWKLVPKSNGLVEVSYTVDFNPGGNVQGWLMETFTYDMPFKTMQNLHSAALDRHEGAKFAFIKEPVNSGVAMTVQQ
ncbi:MAG TPA: START domain-containing protein [Dongiaceae bacterium]|nr:START domain-containing protein [Dongiaceae bacterium]